MSQPYFRVERPADSDRLPIVVDVPHAGEWVPELLADEITSQTAQLKRDLDLYVDQLWADARDFGATLIASEVSRYVIDLNRANDDISPSTVVGGSRVGQPGYYQDRGVVWRTTTDGTAVMNGPLSTDAFDRRIAQFWSPYHGALEEEIARLREQFGFCILVDGHSMPSLGRVGQNASFTRRADIVPGDVDGRSCAPQLTDTVSDHFRDLGFSVRRNQPYKGGWITRNYGRPEDRVHAIQIEVNRDLYMDESSYEPRPSGMERLRAACGALLPKLADLRF